MKFISSKLKQAFLMNQSSAQENSNEALDRNKINKIILLSYFVKI
jgi:hypothetical protein